VENFHQRVNELEFVASASAHDGTPIQAVADHMLVHEDSADHVAGLLAGDPYYVKSKLLTTLLDGLEPKPKPEEVSDVRLYKLVPEDRSPYQLRDTNHIFQLTSDLRRTLELRLGLQGPVVSPNHVVIPAPYDDSCPHGPPVPVPGQPELDSAVGKLHPQPVTVIDAGWQWSKEWGENPLGSHVAVQAQRLPTPDEVKSDGCHWQNGVKEQAGEQVKVDGNDRLLALAGHANFIAGRIRQIAPAAQVSVVNHNGSFLENPERAKSSRHPAHDPTVWDFPTESAVARSLCWVFSKAAREYMPIPKVVNLGFAFLPWSDAVANPPVDPGDGDVVSRIWWSAMQYVDFALEKEKLTRDDVMFVAPAGNQDSRLRRYPAALWKQDSLFDNVLGVASVRPGPNGGGPTRSDFSNYGDSEAGDDWVTCSAIGENVVSSFLRVRSALEDAKDDTVYDFTVTGLASWNGTSFAAPRVAGGIADLLSRGESENARQAWEQLSLQGRRYPDLGIVFV
jgi:Subtilase family